MPEQKLYDELAHLWTLVSDPSDYARAAGFWREALRKRLGPGRHRILELGVGGGHNLSHLTADFEAVAIDRSEKMLANSRKLNPGVEHHVGDMRTVRLGTIFDAVLIQDAVSYLTTGEDVRATLATASAHVRPAGLLVLSPDHFRESFAEGTEGPTTRSRDGTSLTFFDYTWDPDPTDSTYEAVMIFIIRDHRGVRVVEDRHTLGLFPMQFWLDQMSAAGFAPQTDDYPVLPGGRLLVGIRRA